MSGSQNKHDLSDEEKKQFWLKHIKLQQSSGASRVSYCRRHGLSYDQFNYWARKFREERPPSTLLPVQIKAQPVITGASQTGTLCTLTFKNGHELKIHDESVLPLLLSAWG